ncbi:hypothetical protein KIN20_026393 [Parelaphostrongylus tenuis]|uniref:Uncharacterized protein n=1 Tax=Parelaphostrongylus tenuis TaxID=148309 RepID=A0AAD5WD08_PARTN|nr:hypothetical protein KIN20_026393 [Parelaphostrongylus tenuis]
MGLNTVVGTYCRTVWHGNVSEMAVEYLKVSVPAAVVMAPFGSFIGSHFHRQVLAGLVYVLEALSIVGFLITQPPWHLIVISAVIIIFAFGFFYLISRLGQGIMEELEAKNNHTISSEEEFQVKL